MLFCWDEIFRMSECEDESIEDFLENFSFSLQCSRCPNLSTYTIKMFFLHGIQDEIMDALNLISKVILPNYLLMIFVTYVGITPDLIDLFMGK